MWQSASLLLAYPDERQAQRLDTVDRLLAHAGGNAADLLAPTVARAAGKRSDARRGDYVETFDLRRRSTLYLTYWTAGDTRNRGSEMHAFAEAYRAAGVEPPSGSPPTTCRWCLSSRPRWIPRRGGGCLPSTGCRSTCCARR